MSPRVTLPAGVEPVAVVVGTVPPVPAYGTDEPQRPVLCIEPMTAGDARYAEGRRAGLLEAAAHLDESAGYVEAEAGQEDWHTVIARSWRFQAGELRLKVGEP